MSKSESEKMDHKRQKVIVLRNIGIGFGNVKATAENIPPGFDEPKPPEAAELIAKAATDCCTTMCEYCCCMSRKQACKKVNNQCAIVIHTASLIPRLFGLLRVLYRNMLPGK